MPQAHHALIASKSVIGDAERELADCCGARAEIGAGRPVDAALGLALQYSLHALVREVVAALLHILGDRAERLALSM